VSKKDQIIYDTCNQNQGNQRVSYVYSNNDPYYQNYGHAQEMNYENFSNEAANIYAQDNTYSHYDSSYNDCYYKNDQKVAQDGYLYQPEQGTHQNNSFDNYNNDYENYSSYQNSYYEQDNKFRNQDQAFYSHADSYNNNHTFANESQNLNPSYQQNDSQYYQQENYSTVPQQKEYYTGYSHLQYDNDMKFENSDYVSPYGSKNR